MQIVDSVTKRPDLNLTQNVLDERRENIVQHFQKHHSHVIQNVAHKR